MTSHFGITPIVAVPCERTISYAEDVFPWIIKIAAQGWAWMEPKYGRTDRNRIHYCNHLLDNPRFTHIVMLDLDHAHPDHIVYTLCQSVAEDPENRLVVSGLTYRRGEPYDPIAWRLRDDLGKFEVITEWEHGEVLEVDQCSPACTIISRKVFETIPPPWFKYEYYPERDYYPSEDIYFSRQCREYGIRQFVDTRIESPHLRTHRITEATLRAYQAHCAHEQQQEATDDE